ncbi:hypothetical protein AVEN_76841-1 [Araneus ventricosus]|uniref:Uncharacterized protein n=1 Tax=Araneus ventricosus TaxID=182803 RepID=A0A4Y2SDP5_ARAVE|nr:hypothetical protein AVEN_76841-1 [Araneus ventricosus]
MPFQLISPYAVSALKIVFSIDRRKDIYFLYLPRNIVDTLVEWFEYCRHLLHHPDLLYHLYFDSELQRTILRARLQHAGNEYFDSNWQEIDRTLQTHTWTFPYTLIMETYAFLRRQPENYRNIFSRSFVHVVAEYFRIVSRVGSNLKLCHYCYLEDDRAESPRYVHYKKHAEVHGRDLIRILQNKAVWLSNCVRTP